jgi:hypothetical protein
LAIQLISNLAAAGHVVANGLVEPRRGGAVVRASTDPFTIFKT